MKSANKIVIKLSGEEKELLEELIEVEKKKYEAILFKSSKKPRDYSLLESIQIILQKPNITSN